MTEVNTEIVQPRGIDRRSFIRGAATVAWTTPLLVTALATPALANHLPVAAPCNTTSLHCQSGLCCNCGKQTTGCCSGAQGGSTAGTGQCCIPADAATVCVAGQAAPACCSGNCSATTNNICKA